jgi:hypothetical protein
MGEDRSERIEMLRKSIGRGNRSGHYGNAHNNSFRVEVLSDCGGSNVGQSSIVRKYDEENFAVQYYSKNHKLIEDFFVIGIDQDDVFNIEKSLSKKYHPDKNHRQQI